MEPTWVVMTGTAGGLTRWPFRWTRSEESAQLMRHVEQALIERDCPKINLHVRANDDAVVAFYESLRYSVEERVSLGKLIDQN